LTAIPPITTVESALKWANRLLSSQIHHPLREARILLGEVMQVTQEFLVRYPDRALAVAQVSAFHNLVVERSKGTPLPYLLGRQAFYDIEIFVTPDVLIPRPETELLVEKAMAWSGSKHHFIVDVGTGSGAIALTLAKHLADSHVTGIDLSEAALEVARCNGDHLGLNKRVRWLQGDLLKPIIERGEKADLIVANLPYIATPDLENLEVARYEPRLALDGGTSGLEVIGRLLDQAQQVLKPDGQIMLEIGADQGSAIRELVQTRFPDLTVTAIEPDLAGLDRVAIIRHATG